MKATWVLEHSVDFSGSQYCRSGPPPSADTAAPTAISIVASASLRMFTSVHERERFAVPGVVELRHVGRAERNGPCTELVDLVGAILRRGRVDPPPNDEVPE